jgi:hypothetical protein
MAEARVLWGVGTSRTLIDETESLSPLLPLRLRRDGVSLHLLDVSILVCQLMDGGAASDVVV